jgi:hypothetical protein
MSVDPLAGAGAADLAALVDAELSALAANAEALQAMVAQNPGVVLAARVLASNGLTDQIQIAGLRVSAALPPTVHPGDLIQVQVTGTAENGSIELQIVRNYGPVEQAPTPAAAPVVENQLPPIAWPTTPATAAAPAAATTPAPPPPAAATSLPAPAAATPVTATVVPAPAATWATAPAAGPAAPPADSPPPAVGTVTVARVVATQGRSDVLLVDGRRIVAALPEPVEIGRTLPVQIVAVEGEQVRFALLSGDQTAAAADAPVIAGRLLPANVLGSLLAGQANRAPAGPPTSEPAPAGPAARSAGLTDTTAFALRPPTGPAGIPVRGAQMAAPEPNSIEARLAAARAAPSADPASAELPSPPSPRAAPPPLLGRAPIPTAPGRFVAPLQVGTRADAPAPAVGAAAARPTGLSAYTDPVALLRALRLPVTPSGVAAATLALKSPAQLPNALAALEAALPRASDDPHVATLRTLLAFVGRIDPRSPTLSAQIAAYVDQVVTGSESKLAVLLAAAEAAEPTEDETPGGAAPAAAGAVAPVTANAADLNAAALRPLAAALAAERAAALGVDFKQTLLAFAAEEAGSSPVLGAAITGALTALTAVQTEAAQALAARPDGFAFTLPLVTPNGVASAKIEVRRDGADGRPGRADNANFHIAFILETAHFGTVAIDLVTVEREVSVAVRAEAAPAVRAFRDALGHLTARLEALHYRVSSADAKLGSTATVGVAAPPSRPIDPDATVDRSA